MKKIIGIILFCIMLILSVTPFKLFAQQAILAKITGRVTDASTGEPLYFANVFLSNTTLGSASDKDGNYLIENVPPGYYELVISMIGYHLHKEKIELLDPKEITLNFSLKTKVIKGKQISVTAERPKQWKKNLEIFKKIFFGVKDFAKKCKIQNPEVMDFKYNRDHGIFQTFAEDPIIFKNNALGYEVTFFVDIFDTKLRKSTYSHIYYNIMIDNQAFTKETLRCKGSAIFKELLPKNKGERKKIEKNRLKAYNGSQRHFLRSLCEGKLKKEGFEVCDARTVQMYGKTTFSERAEYDVNPDTLLSPSINPYKRILTLPNYLTVYYQKERTSSRRAYQKSWLKINNGNKVTISANGLVIPGFINLVAYGYWARDSADEWLPIDYQPPKKEK